MPRFWPWLLHPLLLLQLLLLQSECRIHSTRKSSAFLTTAASTAAAAQRTLPPPSPEQLPAFLFSGSATIWGGHGGHPPDIGSLACGMAGASHFEQVSSARPAASLPAQRTVDQRLLASLNQLSPAHPAAS